MNNTVTRFAPSPTGNLHIGGIRTALINFIVTEQAKKKYPNSKFLLRIEDTDKKRSKESFKESIINGINWLGINYNNQIYNQSENIQRHQKIAFQLLENNKAFKCICSQADIQKRRDENLKKNKDIKRLCENCETNDKIQKVEKNFVIRIKIPKLGSLKINDIVQGNINIENKEIDNFILLRSDGSPTYLLSAVVDDFDMGINIIIRGDDHINNAFRQQYIYLGMNWSIPLYAHIPLIYGQDGKKLSKRHGAVDINEFKEKGYLKESIINNLILLGWSPNNKNEFINLDEIINTFKISKISKSPSIFDYKKLNHFNNYYLRKNENLNLFINYCNKNKKLNYFYQKDEKKIMKIFEVYKKNLNYFQELENICPLYYDENYKTKKNILLDENFNKILNIFIVKLEQITLWENEIINNVVNDFIKNNNIKFIIFGKPLRLTLINSKNGPTITDILYILEKKDSIIRLKNYINS